MTIHQYFGISTDEAARAERAKKRFKGVRHTVPHWPLIEAGWSRSDCAAYLKEKLPHEVPKSSCVFCPFRTNQSWLHLKTADPDGWARAVEIDNALRDKNSVCNPGVPAGAFRPPLLRPACGTRLARPSAEHP